VTHQQRQQLQQKLADAGLDLMHLERFIGYASNGQKQMNGNQLHYYPFNSLVRVVTGAADGGPNCPSTYKSGWDVPVYVLGFGMPFQRLKRPWHSLPIQRRKPTGVSSMPMACCWPLSSALPALSNSRRCFQLTTRIIILLILQQYIFGGPITPFYLFPFCLTNIFDICLQVQHSQKQSALLLANHPFAQHKSWFGQEVQKNIVSKFTHNTHLLQSIITGNCEFCEATYHGNSTVIALLHTLDHNIHSLDES
jgi:hypothetical protein